MSPSRSITPTSLPMILTEPTVSLRMFATRTPRSFRFTAEELYAVSRVAIRIRRTNERCNSVVNEPVSTMSQSADSQFTRDRHIVECAVDLDACRQSRFGCDRFEPKILAAIQGNRAHGRTAINRQPSWFAINEGTQQQMILSRADERQSFKL